MADFAIGGVFSGPKINQFRELTVQCTLKNVHTFVKYVGNYEKMQRETNVLLLVNDPQVDIKQDRCKKTFNSCAAKLLRTAQNVIKIAKSPKIVIQIDATR